MSKSRLVSGRAKKKLGTELSSSRYDYLDVSNAEPDLGAPPVDNSVLIGNLDGSRTWTDITSYAEEFKGYTGSKGQGFVIAKTYSSVAALLADTSPSGIAPGEFAIIDTDDVEDPENSKLYLWTGTSYNFVTDLSGEQGIKGETGYTGSQGDIGYTGSRGFVGFTGSQGDIGYTGSQGDIGYTGSAGIDGIIGQDGYTGSQGDTGFTGSQGDTGFTGSQGDTGYTGSQGDTGYVGSQGDIGYTGSAGIDGIIGQDGYTGSQGDIGYTGSQGNIGYTGSQGITGFTGSAGTDGSNGSSGTDGSDGYTGSQGYTGSKGESSFTWGPTPPSSPAVGDRWYDTNKSKLVVYVDDGDSFQWVETAASGFLGRTGYTGSAGINGGTLEALTDVDVSSAVAGQVLGYTGSNWMPTAGGGGGSGVIIYETVGNLPVSASNGSLAYVTATNGLYIWNGVVWFLILTASTVNNPPFIIQGPDIGYLLSTDGTPTVITVAAQDPEGVPVQWIFTVTAGILGNTATITQEDNVFTITPSTNPADAGQFELTLTASDGVNLANTKTLIRLRFTSEDFGIGLTAQNTLLPSGFGSNTNVRFGKSVSAMAGTLAVASAGRLENGNADLSNNMVSVYSTLNSTQITPLQEITPPEGIRHFGENNIAMWGNMVLIPGQRFEVIDDGGTLTNIYFRTVHVYYRINGTFELTQTIEFPAGVPVILESNSNANPLTANSAQPLAISNSGLVMACATPASPIGGGTRQLRIYTRESTGSTTWTLRQTVTDSFSGITDFDSFPTMINISSTGKHIALVSPITDDGGTNAGKIYILTNANLNLGIYSWTATGNINTGTGTTDLGVTSTIRSDDIFYFYRRVAATTSSVEMLKYDPESASWLRFPYSFMSNKCLAVNTPLNINQHNHAHFVAMPGRDGTDEVIFMSTVQDQSVTTVSHLVTMRFKNFDISGGSPAGSDNLSINNSVSWHVNTLTIPNNGNLTIVNLLPYLSVDQISGQVYLSTRGTYGGVATSGGVTQYVPITVSDTTKTTTFSKTWYNTTQSYTSSVQQNNIIETITVQSGQNFLHAVCVGGGGGGGKNSTSGTAASGGAGGGLRWITGYPVFPGDIVTVQVGAGGPINSASNSGPGITGQSSRILVNGVEIVRADGGTGGSSTTGFAAGGLGSSTGAFTFAGSTYTIGGGAGGGAGSGGTATQANGSGGGAGAYTAVGSGGGSTTNNIGNVGTGGAGGGGTWRGNTSFAGFGGGVGLYGTGLDPVAANSNNGNPGSFTQGLDFDADNIGSITLPNGTGTFLRASLTGGGGVGSIRDTTSTTCFGGHGGGVRLILNNNNRYVHAESSTSNSFFIRPPTYTGS